MRRIAIQSQARQEVQLDPISTNNWAVVISAKGESFKIGRPVSRPAWAKSKTLVPK
jgi:hypothetical protein